VIPAAPGCMFLLSGFTADPLPSALMAPKTSLGPPEASLTRSQASFRAAVTAATQT